MREADVRAGHGAILSDVRRVPEPAARAGTGNARRARRPQDLNPNPPMSPLVSVFALCATCGRPAFFSCKQCGRPICDKHYSVRSGVCTSCEGGRMVELPPM